MSNRFVTIALAASAAFISAAAWSQAPAYPNQPVRIIVPLRGRS